MYPFTHSRRTRGGRWRRPFALLLAAVLVGIVLVPLSGAAPASAAPGDPFDPAAPRVFVAQDVPTRLYTAVQGDGAVSFQPEGSTSAIGYNAIGFSSVDHYLYGLRRDTAFRTVLVRVGQNGVVTSLGAVTGLPAPPTGEIYNQGVFGSGATANILYVRGSQSTGANPLRAIDVVTGTATSITLSQSVPNLSDLVWKDGFLWGMFSDSRMYRIHPVTGVVASWPTGLGLSTGSFGAQWKYGNGNIGLSDNDAGTVYQVAIGDPTGATPTFRLVSTTPGPSSGNSDGDAIAGLDVDLGIVKTGPAFYTPGASLSYGLTVTNHGPGASSGYQVTDALPAGLGGATTSTPGCAITGGVLRCALAGLAAGATRTITITGTVTATMTGTLTNVASVIGNERDPNPVNDQSTTSAQTQPRACVAVPIWTSTATALQQYSPTDFSLLSSTPLVREYGDIAWSSNGGALYGVDFDEGRGVAPVLRTVDPVTGAELASIALTGPLLTQGTVPGDGTGNYSLNALAALDANTLLVGSYASRAIWKLDIATGVTTSWTQFPNQISSAGDFTVLPDGDILAFGVRPLDGVLSDSRVYRIHPNGSMTQIGTVPAMWGGAQSGGDFYMAAPSGEINRISLATLPVIASTATMSSTRVLSGGPAFWGASAVQDAGACVGLTITKTPTPAVVTGAGQQVTYDFTVTNISDVRIQNLAVTDVQQAPAGALTSGPTCPVTALNPGQSTVCTGVYRATDADVAHGRIDDTATAAGATQDGRSVISNEATATVRVEPVLTWSLAKTASVDGVILADGAVVDPGDEITYTVTAVSAATVPLDGVTLADDLADVGDDAAFVPGSARLTVGGGAPSAVADPVGTVLTAGPFALPIGATASLTYRVVVHDDAWSATLTNVVSGTAGTPDEPIAPEPCGEDCSTTQITPTPLQVQKVGEAATGDVVPMDGSAWAIHATASGDDALIDPLPGVVSGGVPVTGLFRDVTLTAGSYWLEETRALEGFALLAERVPFTVAADGTVTLGAGAAANVEMVEVDGVPTIRVQDVPALDLPDAGGPGTVGISLIGLILLLGGTTVGALRMTRRRRSPSAVEHETEA